MLINCPRCGFSQPQDQYCAQCGVDMQAFKPKSVPLMTKIFQSTKTHVLLLLIAAAFAGQYIIRSEEPQRWVQKITPSSQSSSLGATRTKAKFDNTTEEGVAESASEKAFSDETTGENNFDQRQRDHLESMRNKELSVNANVEQPIQVGSQNAATSQDNANRGASVGSDSRVTNPVFRIIYAEVPIAVLNRWITDSSQLGLYQNLQDYSAGILPDYQKKTDSSVRALETTEKKISVGQSETKFSGMMGTDSSQMIGLATNIEYRSHDGDSVHGSLMVNRMSRQSRDNFPAEFDLPKGAAFFLVGTLRPNSFGSDQTALMMPPFQVFKSPDFTARKTEFVIIIEAEYR